MKILNKLTLRHLKLNKKRTIVTIVGIGLSTILMVCIGLFLSSFLESSKEEIKNDVGDYHVVYENIDFDDINTIIIDSSVSKSVLSNSLGYINYKNDIYDLLELKVVNSNYFDHLNIIEGNIPKNKNEVIIPKSIENLYKLGDTISFDVGKFYVDNQEVSVDNMISSMFEFKVINNLDYKIVGVFDDDVYSSYFASNIISYSDDINDYGESTDLYIYYNDIHNTIEQTKKFEIDGYTFNNEYLIFFGESSNGNYIVALLKLFTIVLVVLTICCSIVIYNSFAISVIERKKQFGILSSIGTTKKQIRKMVLFETLFVGIIGIAIGIALSYLIMFSVLFIINLLIPIINLKVVTYPMFIILPIIFMLITVILSGFVPAIVASKCSSITLIRENTDIKYKKVKTRKYIKKLFGVEGDIALKNLKRNKRKYRITVLSLIVSLVLFISFSTFNKFLYRANENFYEELNVDAYVDFYDGKNSDDFVKSIVKDKSIDWYLTDKSYFLKTNSSISDKNLYADDYYENVISKIITSEDNLVNLRVVDDNNFNNYLKLIGEKEIKPIIYNNYLYVGYIDGNYTRYYMNRYNKFDVPINLTDFDGNSLISIDDYYVASFDSDTSIIYSNDEINIIVPESYVKDINFNVDFSSTLFLNINDNNEFNNALINAKEEYGTDYLYVNIAEEKTLENNLLLCISILVYGFIAVVTLIGVTSVFNTINTSMNLRRREFAMLRSIGLTKKGFNKILIFESLFLGLKAVIFAFPISFVLIILLNKSFGDAIYISKMLIPYDSFIYAFIGVFIIILITSLYSTSKIKKENILETLREENI